MTIKVKFFDTEQFLWAKRSKWNLERWLPFHPVLVGQFITYIFHKQLGTCLESKMFCQSESTAAAVVLEYLIFNIGVVGSWGEGEEKLSHFLSARLALPCPALVLGIWSLWLDSSSLKYHLSLEKTHLTSSFSLCFCGKGFWIYLMEMCHWGCRDEMQTKPIPSHLHDTQASWCPWPSRKNWKTMPMSSDCQGRLELEGSLAYPFLFQICPFLETEVKHWIGAEAISKAAPWTHL